MSQSLQDETAQRLTALEAEHAKDRAWIERLQKRSERLERVLLGLAKQSNTPEWMHDEVGPDSALLCAIASDLAEIDRERGSR